MNYSNKIKYKLFSDAPEVEMVEVEDSDDVYSVGDFLDQCLATCFMDYDGFGRFVKTINGKRYAILDLAFSIDNTKRYAILDLAFSIDNDEVIYNKEFIGSIFYICNNLSIYEIVWFNK